MTDWTAYSDAYDMILEHNPAYQALLQRFTQEIGQWSLPPGARWADLGAGTGNFSLAAALTHPELRVLHLDRDAGMNGAADRKRLRVGAENLEIVTSAIEDIELGAGSLAAVSCVHALYTLPHPQTALAKISCWLEPGGRAFLCDLGRTLDIGDWFRFFTGGLRRERGLLGTAKVVWQGREVLRQNRAIRDAQASGRYWTHDTTEFVQAVEAAGLRVRHVETCYRGYSDLVIAEKPMPESTPLATMAEEPAVMPAIHLPRALAEE